ncbi:undecaprenyldiphospho-muramoylpentapeptide beta-N-acetylglucosaminyltransferase [Campylobacter hepaticus]|uniref:UDP-N-acetylglucosamine--N-acetylmuramyl-(pentapeptide) pyrophosphoryl-undecaprenol N-acetylglucosamine transferase n=1 Tax=Campylobacter hepaticus TaxID=1813019 RepID=A0A6A7JRN4_9BACT|nr:undecaprenyldiphospho-muramoylpentapeptide beta-N-acetylglucosaminyltransferase [Campylobacter hepaticus]AXP08465.1 undecaprenyldiphospho-muramoylpentapeptide beta-N-acetylglucosaminyltransferase [Campylobacter hepaticus]MCZ0772300.1 undecaprenyldiphospho-muramoylpentapeptide beta-N-acetylglucosaminyltransferase [Campylobacter hepaticus]MCZ0773768.1 undecaprenyldiphospho-muramoylpentapeptide beta-N-acetylglucosaminyltransferase [Campylobacter hepaticus]MCZ0775019.1 undecaprenyldiphospho-mura
MTIVLTGGGTGGHLNIVRCLLQSAIKKNINCIYIGSQNGQDKAWFENESAFKEKFFLNSCGVVNQNKISQIYSLIHILKLSQDCKKIFKSNNIKAVFSVGGYSAAPASFAALFSHLPLFIHEQNSKSGSLNLLLKPFAKKFFSAFEKEFTPYPIADKFFNYARIRKEIKNIIFLGGSQGAQFINDLALNLAPKLQKQNINIIHQCGKNDFEKCQKKYQSLNIQADLFDFTPNLEKKMQQADLAISRSGASTLFELCANNLPAIFIPYPYAAKNHQYFNAKFLQDQALCKIFTQNNINLDILFQTILNLNLEDISTRLKNIAQKNGAELLLNKALFNDPTFIR